jgi:phospholipase C
MSPSNAGPRFDHLVLLMLENRSFDNLLGYLYDRDEPLRFMGGGTREFRGVAGRTDLWNETDDDPPKRVSVHRAPYLEGADMIEPFPDPGEAYSPHVNHQLYGVDDVRELDPLPDPAPMSGFLSDYVRASRDRSARGPGTIMQCFTPEAVPVLSTLAREFAVSDEWFSSLPTQTLPNRSFLHSGQSHGWVQNAPYLKWADNLRPTVFERLAAKLGKRSWRVYWDPRDHFSLTKHLHTQLLDLKWLRNFRHMDRFRRDCAKGDLPAYTVVEPRLYFDHNDMHPPSLPWVTLQTSSVLAGEMLLAEVYGALRDGPLWERTLFVILFDEHGGCYDHWPPPRGAIPPYPADSPLRFREEDPSKDPFGFGFDRFGVRVPAIFVSPSVDRGTVIRAAGSVPFCHTSVIRTLSERWDLEPLTDRDARAPSFADVLCLEEPRKDRVTVTPRPYDPPTEGDLDDVPLHDLQRGMAALVSELHGVSLDGEVRGLGQALSKLARARRWSLWTSARRSIAAWLSKWLQRPA